MKLSVIVPIYKTEKYLDECVNSILECTSREIELILVDDGSPDNCPQMCEEFAKIDSRVKVVHKENGGLSSARNAGLSVANGKYVTFIDSDDKIYSDSIPKILQWISDKGADICFLQAEKIYSNGTSQDLGECIKSKYLCGVSREEAIAYLASRPKYPGSAWAKLYKRKFLFDNDLHFPYDRRYSEDLGFIRDCIMRACEFDALEFPFYQYRQNRIGSITNHFTAKNFNDLFLFVEETDEKLDARNNSGSIVKNLMHFAVYEYLILLYLYTQISREDRREALIKLKKYQWVLKYALSKKEKVVRIICKFFGIRITAFLMKQYKRTV